MSKNKTRIGIDIGGVIIGQDTDEPDLFFSKKFLSAKPTPHCFETIKTIIDTFSNENVFIISKCGTDVQKKSIAWLEDKLFFTQTGFKRENIHFCLERQDKAIIAASLNLTHFIDDRYTVLMHMESLTTIEKLFLFNPNVEEEKLMISSHSKKTMKITSWLELKKMLMN